MRCSFLILLLVSALSGCGTAPPGPAAAPGAAGLGASLPWPAEGQAAVEVEGLGALGAGGEPDPVPIASVTKVMTAHVILARHPLRPGDDGPLITVDRTADHESHSGRESTVPLREGHRVRLRHLLELMMVPSGNNAARLLARWDAGTQERFVARMNAAARRLGMTATTYTGASGNEDSTVSTAPDQLKLAREAMRDPVFREVVARTDTAVPGEARRLPATNTLLNRHGVIGVKTGSGTAAGGNLVWASRVRGRLVLGVILAQAVNTNPVAAKAAVLEEGERMSAAVERWLRARPAAPGQETPPGAAGREVRARR
ncbi:D-alanyl-D-alanine carboxypeptidase family protein [Bailinhaonella thermotolerans]|uniref:D-alanyl-D-alanine carboxypeptidase n=1 Tax=Bailinhaonella thermotolerans TaxID=1070861 RepID=A0A3A4BJS4_9ACTN|nr:serine hydrolase [Bailinhaonella thermotolerans]RJL35524.1 D-alanyl-D-alanine carboxypeptidase [Bailinhaonella thermotolerans]